MAWNPPMTAVANTPFTAAQFNTFVRDNLLETSPAKATAGVTTGSYPVKTATNQIGYRQPSIVSVLASQSTSNSAYTNLATTGPSATLTTGSRALVAISADVSNNSTNSSYMSVEVSGATSFAATDDHALRFRPFDSGGSHQASHVYMFTTLNPGSNTFTCKYRALSGTGTWQNRHIVVLPF